STNVGGVIDLAAPPTQVDSRVPIIRAGNGFLTPLEARSMLDCLELLAAEPALALGMGSVGRSFALAHYSEARLQTEIESLYTHLLDPACTATNPQVRPSLEQSA
ncbi:MAG TPA: hypothetical protein VK513_01685, partial [Terriglobales bacterium]|nr:hypothetical protein [Terriglobales bacterium]